MVSTYDADLIQSAVICKVCDKDKKDGHVCLSPTQWDFINSEKRFVALVSGRNCGKTFSALCRLATLITRPEYRGCRILVWGPTYNQLKKGTLIAFDEFFYKLGFIKGGKDGNEPEREMVNDILVVFRNASNPDQTRGHEYAVNWLDEAGQMEEQVFRLTNMATRQRRPDGSWYPRQMLITTTPTGRNWIYRYFKDESNGKFLGHELSDHFETNTLEAIKYGIADENFIKTGGYVEGTQDYDQEILGLYVTWGGMVFYAFDERKHYDRTYAPPKFEHVYGGIDLGQSAPTAITLTGITEAGQFVTFKEFYQRNCPPSVWMNQALQWQKEFNVRTYHIDNNWPRDVKTFKSMGGRATLAMKANDAANTAVGFLNGLMVENRIKIMNCPNLKREIEGYEVKEILSGDERTFLDKVKPNLDDHAIDSWRYHVPPLSSVKAQQSYGKEIGYSIRGAA